MKQLTEGLWAVYHVTMVEETKKRNLDLLLTGSEAKCKAEAERLATENSSEPWAAYQALPYRPAYQERADHGVGSDLYLRGNMWHLLSPIIGSMKMDLADGDLPSEKDLKHYVSRLYAVLALVDEAEGAYIEGRYK